MTIACQASKVKMWMRWQQRITARRNKIHDAEDIVTIGSERWVMGARPRVCTNVEVAPYCHEYESATE